jgi:hypothetical protein
MIKQDPFGVQIPDHLIAVVPLRRRENDDLAMECFELFDGFKDVRSD